MKRLALSLALSFAALATVAGIFAAGLSGLHRPDRSQAAPLTNLTVPISLASFVPCANRGLGEVVTVTGPLHVAASSTTDALGNRHASLVFNSQGLTGVGAISANKYQGGVQVRVDANFAAGINYQTFTINILLIGQGQASNLVFHLNGYVTIFPDHVLVNMVRGFVSCS